MALRRMKEGMKMEYRLIASDLDGTLLNKDGRVSPENWAAIEKLRNLGISFVPATGRAFGELPAELRESPLIRYYITSNGAAIYDKVTGNTYDLGIPQALGREVLDKLYSYPVNIFFHAENNSYVEESTHNIPHYQSFHMNKYWVSFALEKEVPIADLKKFAYSLPSFESISVFFKNMEDLRECWAFFQQDGHLQLAQTDPYNIEFCATRAGKGNALRLLSEVLSIPIEATIGVGDSTNDMTMIQTAGLGLAMSNAVPEIKAAADDVICSNQEHGIRYILEHYIEK